MTSTPATHRHLLPLLAVGIVALLVIIGFWSASAQKKALEEIRTAPAGDNSDPRNAGMESDVPDYAAQSDAKVTSRSETDAYVKVAMESINGVRSPVVFYQTKLKESGWSISEDTTGDEGGMITARKGSRTIEVTITALPGGAGSTVEVTVKK